jgi:hypothetical protein
LQGATHRSIQRQTDLYDSHADVKAGHRIGSAVVGLTDGERITLAILAVPILPNAIGGGVAPIAPERVAAIWTAALAPVEEFADQSVD